MLDATGTGFTNALLYQSLVKLDAIADITDWNFDWLQTISGKLDKLTTIDTDVGVLRTDLQRAANSLATISNTLRNSAGTAIDALQGGLSYLSSLPSVSSSLSSGGISAASWLNRISSQLGTDGALVGRLTSGDMGAASWLNRISSQLNSGGALANRLDSAVSLLSILGTISSQLGTDGALSGRLDVLADRLSYTPAGSSTLQTAGGMLWQLLSAVRDLDIPGIIDGIETGSTSVVQQLAKLPGILQSGFSSVVDGLGAIDIPSSITATLSPDATISAETDVAGEAAQSATLWDTIVGDVDTPQIKFQMDSCVGYLRTSFPFGLIFVIVDTLGALSASPVAPVFDADVPAVVGTYHMELDLSYFDPVAALFRGGFVVLYVFGLYSVTKQWVFNAGGDSA